MRRWRVTILVLFVGGSCLFGGTRAQAGFSIELNSRSVPSQEKPESSACDQAFTGAFAGDICCYPEPGPGGRIPNLGDFHRRSSIGFRDPLSHGSAPFFITPYGIARKANSQIQFASFSTAAVAALGQKRWARNEQTQRRTVASPVSRPRANTERVSQASFEVDVRPPSSLVLGFIGWGCCLL